MLIPDRKTKKAQRLLSAHVEVDPSLFLLQAAEPCLAPWQACQRDSGGTTRRPWQSRQRGFKSETGKCQVDGLVPKPNLDSLGFGSFLLTQWCRISWMNRASFKDPSECQAMLEEDVAPSINKCIYSTVLQRVAQQDQPQGNKIL